jgi:hypothetical protein
MWWQDATTRERSAVPELRALLDTVLRDFAGTPVDGVPTTLVLADPVRPEEFASLDPVLGQCADPDEARLLLRVAGNVTTLDPALDEQEILVDAASYLQDYVIDQWSRPWPQTGHDAPRVLEPFLGPDRTAVWGDRRSGVPHCAVGTLQQHRDG